MQALMVIDAQNEFSARGQRPVPNHADAIKVIKKRVDEARQEDRPIAWVRHRNRPDESPAFVLGTWGAEFSPGFGPDPSRADSEAEFQKDVYGAFTGSNVGEWLRARGVDEVLLVGFYTHGCVSTSAREAIMLRFGVSIDLNGTGACDLTHELLGKMLANEVRRSALLQLASMGANLIGDRQLAAAI